MNLPRPKDAFCIVHINSLLVAVKLNTKGCDRFTHFFVAPYQDFARKTLELCASFLSPPSKQGFEAFDYDRDGKISGNDLDKTFKRMQIEDVREEDIIEFATFLDRDQDGFITRCERYDIVPDKQSDRQITCQSLMYFYISITRITREEWTEVMRRASTITKSVESKQDMPHQRSNASPGAHQHVDTTTSTQHKTLRDALR
jgi:hypothetical protein